MSSERNSDGFVFSCDYCGEVFTPPKLGRGSSPRDWQESWQEAKEAGWRAQKWKGDWEHRCPNCQG